MDINVSRSHLATESCHGDDVVLRCDIMLVILLVDGVLLQVVIVNRLYVAKQGR